ncbi:MAG TPA: diacylglycerol kinase family protein [Gemmatimonadaceae bacterium]|nr:diacylglycerol kinase family protein [Gemmatimonadaceae bacterium]
MALLIRSALLIVNPAARRARAQRANAEAVFRRAGVHCPVVETSAPGHAAELARACPADTDAVFTLGGDGTVMEVLGALACSGIPVAILPGGTGNLVARTLGIPRNVPRAVEALLQGERITVDMGAIGGRRFVFAAGMGIDTRMIAGTTPRMKRALGVAAYWLTAARAALARRDFELRVRVDEQVFIRRASAVMVANFGTMFGNLIHFGPGIGANDGRLDLCVFSPESTGDAIRVAWRLLRKDFRDDPCVHYASGRKMHIETAPPQRFQADGELLGTTPVEIEVVPGAATLMVPRGRGALALAPTGGARPECTA